MLYDAETKVLIMDLVDLEHCGFDHGDLDFELRVSGIDNPDARWPVALLVNFSGGAVVGPQTSPDTIIRMTDDAVRFGQILSRLRNDK